MGASGVGDAGSDLMSAQLGCSEKKSAEAWLDDDGLGSHSN
jgi:hypothetical protein